MLCLNGACSYRFNDQLYEMRAGDLSIIRKRNLIEDVNPSTDFDLLKWRIDNVGHRFHRETIINAMQATILDFFDFHAQLYGENDISTQNASIMSQFLSMLEDGAYREHREVAYYAHRLCVSPKYLSEVSKKVSGSAANHWINRYTILDISRLLRNKSLTFSQISDMFGFSSLAYFSRYVKQNLGVMPSQQRK